MDYAKVSVVSNKGYEAIMPTKTPVVLTWSGLVVATKGSDATYSKILLDNVTGQITGGFWAVMGSSGSGKTTLLSALSLRLDTRRISVKGELRCNGRSYTKRDLKNMSGYVMQDDLLNAYFTVLETLQYTAHLRMPADTSAHARRSRIELVMRLMGISHCRHVIVGDSRVKGVSGGERKRLCIAMELLTKPKLLFLDEPTSGLDSSTALSVVGILKRLAAKGLCTVVCTIHQPQSRIFSLFDNLVLMRRGQIAYQGTANKALAFFENQGFPCPELTNPADHIIQVLSLETELERSMHGPSEAEAAAEEEETREFAMELLQEHEEDAQTKRDLAQHGNRKGSVDANDAEQGLALAVIGDSTISGSRQSSTKKREMKVTKKNSTAFMDKAFVVHVDLDLGSDLAAFPARQMPSWPVQFYILYCRSLHSLLRRWDILIMNIFVTLLIATFVCMSVWRDIGDNKVSGAKRMPALFFCVIHQGIVASMQGTHAFPLERALMLRERAAGTYSVSAYFLGKTFADLTVQVLSPILFSVLVYPVIGFANSSSQFATFVGFMILTAAAATSLANMISCVCVGIEMATVVLAAAYEISRLFGAWFISPKQLSLYPEWRFADALSYIKYSFVGVALNEFQHLHIYCDDRELTKSVSSTGVVSYKCVIAPLNNPPYSGSAYSAYYGFDQYTVGGCASALVLYIVSCRIIAYLALRFIKV